METYEKLQKSLESIRRKTDFVPKIGVVLGSGLGAYGEKIRLEQTVDYREIEGFPVSTVQGHKGRFLLGYIEDVPVVLMQGRVHYYEGYAMSDVVLPIRLMGMMGAQALMLTNASGGVNESFASGDLMMITDQISSFVPSPLIGKNADELGRRFPDMTEIYDRAFFECIRRSAAAEGIALKEGVYLQLTGPNFETPAEIRMVRALGGDAVGMSTACEAIAARHMGLRVAGISCISNLAAGMTGKPLGHEEVQETADRVAHQFARLVTASVSAMAKVL